MDIYKFTDYFENEVLRKRPYLKKEWCINVIENPLKAEPQENNRFRFWGVVDDLEGRILRVVTLEDKRTFIKPFLTGGTNHKVKLLPGNRFSLYRLIRKAEHRQ